MGYELTLAELRLGISASRARWLVVWFRGMVRDKVAHVGRFSEGLGRATFVFGALDLERPFLAPLYTFVSLHPLDSIRALPLFALMVMTYLADRLEERRAYPCAVTPATVTDPPRVDAKAEGERSP